MIKEEPRSPQRTDSFVQTDIAGVMDLPPSSEAETTEGNGESGAFEGTVEEGTLQDSTLKDVEEEDFRRGDFLESTRNDDLNLLPDSDDPERDESLQNAEVGEGQEVHSGGDDSEPALLPTDSAIGISAPHFEGQPIQENTSDAIQDSADFTDLPENVPEVLPGPEGTPRAPDDLMSVAEASVAGREEAGEQGAQIEEAVREAVSAGQRDMAGQEIEVSLTAEGDPRYVSVQRNASGIQQHFRATMRSVIEEGQLECQPQDPIMFQGIEECLQTRSQDSPSCESIYHDALSTPPEDTPLMKTTIQLTIMARSKEFGPRQFSSPMYLKSTFIGPPNSPAQQQPENVCRDPQIAQNPCQAMSRTGDDREGRLARCAADSILGLMSNLEKKGAVDRSARMVLSPRGIVICLRPSGPKPCGHRESCHPASTGDEQTSKSPNQENLTRQCPPSKKDDNEKLRPCCKKYLARKRPSSRGSESSPPTGHNQNFRPCNKECTSRKCAVSKECMPSTFDEDDQLFRSCCPDELSRQRPRSRECESIASTRDDQSSSPCYTEHAPVTMRKPCSRAVGVQTDEVSEIIHDESSQIEIRPPVQFCCICGSNYLQDDQSCEESDEFYSMYESFSDVQGEPCSRPQDDFMNPFPCPYYPACLENQDRNRQVRFCEPVDQIQNFSDAIDSAPIAQPSYRGNQLCEAIPDSEYVSSIRSINNATYVISHGTLQQDEPQTNYYSEQPLAPGNARSSCQAGNYTYARNNADLFQPYEPPVVDYGVPAGRTNMPPWAQKLDFQCHDFYGSPPANEQFQQESRQKEEVFFSYTGDSNQQKFELNCQLPPILNFSDEPPHYSMGRNSSRFHQPEERMTIPSNPPQAPRESRLTPDWGSCNVGVAPTGVPTSGDSSSHHSLHNSACLIKKDSIIPLTQEITRLEQIIDKIVELAMPLTEHFSKYVSELPALRFPQQITDRESTERTNGTTRSRVQADGICPERPNSGQSENVPGEMEAAGHGFSRSGRNFTLTPQLGTHSEALMIENGPRNMLWDNSPFPHSESSTKVSTLGSISTPRNSFTRADVPNGIIECTEFSGEKRSQARFGALFFGQEMSSSISQRKLFDCPVDSHEKKGEGFSGSPRCTDYSGSGSRQKLVDQYLSQCLATNQNFNSNNDIRENLSSPQESDNECNSRLGSYLKDGKSERYNMATNNHAAYNKKPLPAVCDKHRAQASKRGFI